MSVARVAPVLSRRRALALLGMGASLPVVAACTTSTADEGPDPLIPLAIRARSDAALIAAAITATPAVGTRLDPLRVARTDHATALQQAIDRRAGATSTPTPAPAAAPPAGPADLDAVRQAMDAAAKEAAGLIGTLPTTRVGLVGSVAACCTAYAVVLAVPA